MGRALIKKQQLYAKPIRHEKKEIYSRFSEINGEHPWQQSVPEGCVLYPVRRLEKGKVAYFNFRLAKEMGLIPQNHPEKMNARLHKEIIRTFSLQIINEYDQKQNVRYLPSVMCEHRYMATRYLQLQHDDKSGRTSGDGRSIWNGTIKHRGTTWDLSSRGTGVTRLAPGAVDAKKPIKTGSTDFGYGCGTADLDELLASALMAEIFHANGIATERVLTVIDLGKDLGIGVRAGKNLFRPAHLFMHLKQNAYEPLRRAVDYYIDRQHSNKEWNFNSKHKEKYKLLMQEISEGFAYFAAQLDREYIFAWLDWDGDNVLANAGIIDYGSIRQFGLRHDEYRYDDVDRFSTNLKEQKSKARLIVQVFAQMTDYLQTKNKKTYESFRDHPAVLRFDENFDYYLMDRFLMQAGFARTQREELLTKRYGEVQSLYSSYTKLESLKTLTHAVRVPDGINRPAILNMRLMLVDMPEYMFTSLQNDEPLSMPVETFFALALAESATSRDQRLSRKLEKHILDFQNSYIQFMKNTFSLTSARAEIKKLIKNAKNANRSNRMTGDGVLYTVDELMKHHRKNKNKQDIQQAIDVIIAEQTAGHQTQSHSLYEPRLHQNRRVKSLVQTVLELIDGFKESI